MKDNGQQCNPQDPQNSGPCSVSSCKFTGILSTLWSRNLMWRQSSQNMAKLWASLFIRALPSVTVLMREVPVLLWQERMAG